MNDLSKNMDNFFNNLIDTMPNISNSGNKIYTKNTSNFYSVFWWACCSFMQPMPRCHSP